MNKRTFLNWLSLLILVVTSAQVPMAATNRTTAMTGGASSSGSSENVIRTKPEVQRVGLVVAYVPGQTITIVDRAGTQFTFELASPKILPSSRAAGLGPGSFVTIIAPNNVPGGKHIAVGIVIHRGVPPGFSISALNVPKGTSQPPPPLAFPEPNTPLPPDVEKPTEAFSPIDMSSLPPLQTIVGYTFPGDFTDWSMPIRVAAFVDITIDSVEPFTPVGMVEIGSDQTNSNIFLVAIDLVSTGAEVQGMLIPIPTTVTLNITFDTLDVTFLRMPQILNPERTDSPYEEFQELDTAPTSFSTIYADGVCFVATTADGPIKYCSKPSGPDEPASQLSAMDNFPSQYAELQDLIIPVAQQFELLNVIQLDQIISMQEDTQHIQDCASELTQQACGADVVVAPVSEEYFQDKFEERFGEENGDDGDDDDDDGGSVVSPTAIDVAVVKVLRPIETSANTIQPGDYRVDYWFDSNGLFYAATLTGVTTTNISVINQQVPAVPASLINATDLGPQQPGTQISACRIFRRCLWFQKACG